MKYALLGTIVFVCWSCALAANSTDSLDKERQSCVDGENSERRSKAKHFGNGIANMNKLRYDKDIEKLKVSEKFECPSSMSFPEYSKGYYAFPPQHTFNIVQMTRMACIKHEKCGNIVVVNGPIDPGPRKLGDAGSACSGAVEDGLCIASSASLGEEKDNTMRVNTTQNNTAVTHEPIVGSSASLGLFLIFIATFLYL